MSAPFATAGAPRQQGLYHPSFEHDACGVGFVANIDGSRNRRIIDQALTILESMSHRGARGADINSGDGAGILLQIPHAFFKKQAAHLKFKLPEISQYAVGMMFLPADAILRSICIKAIEQAVFDAGQFVLGWRHVPTNDMQLGPTAKASQPHICQVFIGHNKQTEAAADSSGFERILYSIRKSIEKTAKQPEWHSARPFYICSMSSRTIVYKGMLLAEQLRGYFPDLACSEIESALALVHSRFSTNTFPSWERAHPYRTMAHNGEINTLRGNINWMKARQGNLQSRTSNLGGLNSEQNNESLPIIDETGSDSGMFDNCLEFLHVNGRSLPHAAMMMIPEPWQQHRDMPQQLKDFYQYHSLLMEPWDGPACVCFSDGTLIGAMLDRNGLRPARYTITHDNQIILASEVGVIDIHPSKIARKERLQPGQLLLVDTAAGRIVGNDELKTKLATQHPYGDWIKNHLFDLENLATKLAKKKATETKAKSDYQDLNLDAMKPEQLRSLQQAFGYTLETLNKILSPMALKGEEALGSMGDDTPLAILSARPQLLYQYFKQQFAQVTNPPIDAIREELVTSTEIVLGKSQNILAPEIAAAQANSLHLLRHPHPILTNYQLECIRVLQTMGLSTGVLSTTIPLHADPPSLAAALDQLFVDAETAIANGATILLLSDIGVSRTCSAIPALLAVSGLHHYLIGKGLRHRVSIVVQSAEPREVHHFACLIGYGANAVNPYLAFESIKAMRADQTLIEVDEGTAEKNYIKAVVKGLLKIMSKMGISTIQSYCGAQIFEAVGISNDVIDRYFCKTTSRVGGLTLDQIFDETMRFHIAAYGPHDGRQADESAITPLESGGVYQWRAQGEKHTLAPETIHTLQKACRSKNYETYKKYAALIHDDESGHNTLRSMLEFTEVNESIPLSEVESIDKIVRRFKTGAMSYGSISKEAHETLAIAMNRLGGKSNSGEGGEDPERYETTETDAETTNGATAERSSAIKQIASGRFGVTSEYLLNAKELQIKIAQGAKPGEGGQLPGTKVYPWIAKVRHSTPGVGLISPPPHHDIYSIEDLAQLISDLKHANPRARIGVKLVSATGVGTVAAGVAKGHADSILISGYDGGTGASPQTSIKHAGLPWELGLAETHQTLVLNGLRSRVRLETDGQLRTGRDIAIAALLGAEEFGFGTIALVTLGCLMMRACHLDTCPVGIATQDPRLRKHYAGNPEHIINFMRFVAEDLREIMARLGFRTLDEMIGRSDRLMTKKLLDKTAHDKLSTLDLSALFYSPAHHAVESGRHLESMERLDSFDVKYLLKRCLPALEKGKAISLELPISNRDRSVGTLLGSEITRHYGASGLPDDTIRLHFKGSAGQSIGAFIPNGLTIELQGDANDYVGKGLSGGKILVYPPQVANFKAEENVIIGNTAFYGATSGRAFICGRAGERFAVRNSGAVAVVEGVGDHGCEYMTGGRVVVLGKTGRNFAAGMSGGIAYVLDEDHSFERRCNQSMVVLEKISDIKEIQSLKQLIILHLYFTGSEIATKVLANWNTMLPTFIKVIPKEDKVKIEGATVHELPKRPAVQKRDNQSERNPTAAL